MAGRGTDIALDDAARAAVWVAICDRDGVPRCALGSIGNLWPCRPSGRPRQPCHICVARRRPDARLLRSQAAPSYHNDRVGQGLVPGILGAAFREPCTMGQRKRNSGIRKSLLDILYDSLDELLAFYPMWRRAMEIPDPNDLVREYDA